jgi:hypothetical protein
MDPILFKIGIGVIALFWLVFFGLIFGNLVVAVYVIRKGRLPHALQVLRDAQQPTRYHKHYHYGIRRKKTKTVT